LGEVLINALKGEAVLNRRATSAIGASGVDALNKGAWDYPNLYAPRPLIPTTARPAISHQAAMPNRSAGEGGMTVNVNATIQAWDGQDTRRAFEKHIIPELKRELVMPRHGLMPIIQQRVLS
jgi:hypothetical protein